MLPPTVCNSSMIWLYTQIPLTLLHLILSAMPLTRECIHSIALGAFIWPLCRLTFMHICHKISRRLHSLQRYSFIFYMLQVLLIFARWLHTNVHHSQLCIVYIRNHLKVVSQRNEREKKTNFTLAYVHAHVHTDNHLIFYMVGAQIRTSFELSAIAHILNWLRSYQIY